MSQISKIAFSILLILVLLGAAAYAGTRMLLADPDRYREALAQQLAASTGYVVRFQNLEWQLWPDLSIRLEGIVIDPLLGKEPLAVIDTLAIDVKLLPLLRSDTFLIDSIAMGAIKLNLFIDANGQSNYQTTDAAQPRASSQAADASPNASLEMVLSSFTVESITVHYVDASIAGAIDVSFQQLAGTYSDHRLNLVLEDVLRYSDSDLGITFDGQTEGAIVYHLKTDQVVFDGFSFRGDLSTPIQEASPFITALTGVYTVAEDAFVFEQITIEHLGLTTGLTGVMTAVTQPLIRLGLDVSTTLTNPDAFNTAFANQLDPFAPITELTLSTTIQGTDVAPEFSKISGRFNGSAFNGEAAIDLPAPSINLTLNLSALNLNIRTRRPGRHGWKWLWLFLSG